ncbi:hypothetical protein CEUSTIGMA_g6195.t1 [Chlamydomonas eustigma]|uniref:DNA mismatch repair proteins mutS family domain-containing protein n=1 Tax=Chlamydomonas eustigma TaxID=1157962 RepID=A0A250X6Q3_9CHLO|nr:hypothetical protein CEUSTIGMA_g6195.t1 [Chlamydomonas eustigma]|eukprot:GAX78758.1 hypothetical protein CEUSTIGMA_g6195.t1 [Chlamydomonas eustigma]
MLQKRGTGECRLPCLGRLRAPNLFHSIRKSNTTLQYRIVCSPPALSTSWGSSSMPFDENLDDVGPAASATMKMLEWNSLCEQVAEFASTHVGRRLCLALQVPESISETEALLHETRAMTMLEYDFSTTLDFGGIATTEAESAIKRAAKGGLCSTSELKGAVSLFLGAEALKKQIVLSARVHEVQAREAASRRNTDMKAGGRNSGDAATSSVLTPLLRLLTGAVPAPSFCRNVRCAIDDEGRVVDAASEALSMQRGRVRAAEARLASLLRGYQGEVSEQSGRMCVVMIAGTKMPPGAMLLGSSAGGSMLYVEPPAAVPLNNDLGAARAQAEAAEEDVLHSLTGQLMGILTEAEACLQMVSRLDLLCAKTRYGAWLGAELPDVVPWDTVFHSRGSGGVQRFIRQEVMPDASGAEDEWDDRYMVRLRSLRHPLLYGSYLKQKQALEKRVRQEGGSIDKSLMGSQASAARSKGSHRMLSTRRENMFADSGLTAPKDGKGTAAGAGELTAQEQLAALSAPRPIDILIRRDTSAVIITGPNTGGKTAALKALGLTALMVRVGLPIPAEVPVALPAFSSVLADIGDEQSLTANLSTFSGHLKRIQALRAEADGKALVLLDELGTGTDPTEGAALGVALLRKMVSGGLGGGALIVATTHHSIMTGLKFEDQRFENASVEFDEVKLAPTYKLLWGIPGRSNALNIAERLGLDSDVVGAARQRMDTGAVAADSVITQLELLREKSEALSKLVMAQEQESRTLVRELELMEQEVDFKRAELGQARKNSLFEVWSRARERLKAVKEMKKKRQQGRLPSGVTLESLIGSQDSNIKSACGASSLTASVEKEVQVDSLEDAYRELEQLVRPSQEPSPEAVTAGLQERSLTGSAVLTIADYHEKDVSDVFDDLAGLYQQRMEVPEPAELTPGEVKYTKVVNAIEDFILDADTPGILQTAAGELDQDFMERDVNQALSEQEAPSTGVQNQQSISEEVGEDEDYLRLLSLVESTMLVDDSVKQTGGNHGSKGQHSQSPSDDGGEDGLLGDDDMAAFVSSLESMQISPSEMKDEDEADLASALLRQMEVLEATASSSSVRDGLRWSVDQQSKSSRSSGRSGRSGIGTNISTVADGPRMYSNFGKQPRYNEPADESREGDDRMEQSDSGYSREREEELDLDALVSNLEEDLLTLQACKLAGMSKSRASKGQSTSIKKAVHKTKERKTNA